MKMSALDRVLLLGTGLLAAYQIVVGIDKLSSTPITAYTIGFGVMLLSSLLLFILGFGVLDNSIVVIISTIIPLGISTGLIWEHLAPYRVPYLTFAIVGFLAVVLTRSISKTGRLPTIVLAVVHGVAGLIIFVLPIYLAAQGRMNPAYALVGLGGALMGMEGIFLSFLKTGEPVPAGQTMRHYLPWLLLITTICFVAGFKLG